jgi:hypothetical protein
MAILGFAVLGLVGKAIVKAKGHGQRCLIAPYVELAELGNNSANAFDRKFRGQFLVESRSEGR